MVAFARGQRPFAAALRGVLQSRQCRFGFRERNFLTRQLDENPELIDMIETEFQADIEAMPDPPAPAVPVPPGAEPRPVFTWFAKCVRWILENQDLVLSFVQGLASIIAAFIV